MSMDPSDSLGVTITVATVASSWLLNVADRYRPKKRRRHYLTRLSLPVIYMSAWRSVLSSPDDKALLNTTSFDAPAFRYLAALFVPQWLQQTNRPFRHSMSPFDVLGLVLKHLTSRCADKELCQIFAQPPVIVSRNKRRGIQVLLSVVRDDHQCRISWPTEEEMEENASLIQQRHSDISHVFGYVDGVYFPMEDPSDPFTQNAYYNGWKAMCSVTNVLVFAADGCIVWAHYNLPGSWHDAKVAMPLYEILTDTQFTPFLYALISDTAFPRSGLMRRKIITPRKVDEAYHSNLRIALQQQCYNSQVVSARQAVEWGMHTIQCVFRRLSVKLKYHPVSNAGLLKLIFHLFNLRTRLVGLNQIRTVYEGPIPE